MFNPPPISLFNIPHLSSTPQPATPKTPRTPRISLPCADDPLQTLSDPPTEDQYFQLGLQRMNSRSSTISLVRLISCNSTTEQELYKKFNHRLLHTSEVYIEIGRIVTGMHDQIALDEDSVLLLLHENKWSEEKAMEDFFDRYQQLKNCRYRLGPYFQEGVCTVCCEDSMIWVAACGHGCCMECWNNHANQEISNRKAFIKCVDYQCKQLLLHSFIKSLRIDMKQYIHNLSAEYVSQNKSLRYCPGVDCEYCFQDLSLVSKNVACKCGTRFCFKCGREPHEPCTCEEIEKWFVLTRNQMSNETWIKSHTKICPTCRNTIERAFGCNFISCTCGENFCYHCSKKWDQSHLSHYECPFKQEISKPNRSLAEISAFEITCLYETFLLNNSIQKYTALELKKINLLRQQIKEKLRVPESETLFIEIAFEKMQECRGILKWAEIFQYFHKNHNDYDLREFSMSQFRRELERCGFALADFIKKVKVLLNRGGFVIQTNTTEFFKQRESILKMINQTDSYVRRFMEQVQR